MPALVVPTLAETLATRVYTRDTIDFGRAPLTSSVCRSEHFLTRGYAHWCRQIGETPKWHRKQWEYCFILQALADRGMLAEGKRGLGFGVGREPLAGVMTAHGCSVVETDAPEDVAGGWKANYWKGHARAVDMRAIPDDLTDFDFTYSSCAFEHLGDARTCLKFLIDQGRCLKVGGVGVHTTELRLDHGGPVELPRTVVFDRAAIESVDFAKHGLRLSPVTWRPGNALVDRIVDDEPHNDQLHLRLLFGGCVTTSIGLIVSRQSPPLP